MGARFQSGGAAACSCFVFLDAAVEKDLVPSTSKYQGDQGICLDGMKVCLVTYLLLKFLSSKDETLRKAAYLNRSVHLYTIPPSHHQKYILLSCS